jgi:choline dehydrogenase-like flavoprotein
MIRKLYKEGGLQQTKRFDLTILQGECVGGSTVINNAICFRMPEQVQKRWTDDFGLDLSALDQEYDRIGGELEISTLDPIAVNTRVEAAFRAGVAGYNATMPNGALLGPEILRGNFRNELGTGLANIGDRHVRKRSMLETYVPWAEAHGATTIGNLSAVRFVAQNRRATSVMVRTSLGALKTIRVRKAVVVSGGVIASSNFLMRSGLRKNVGQRTSCNFAFPLAFDFAEEMRAYDGVQITLGATDPQNRAVFETYFNPPGSFALSLPFYFERRDSAMSRYSNLVNFGGLVGAESNGVVERTPDILSGRAFTWELGDGDRTNIKYALATLVEIGRHAGATRAFLPTEPGIELPLDGSSVDRFRAALAGFPLTMSSLRLTTAHPQGGNGMYGDGSPLKGLRVVDGEYRLDGFENVFVADASIFPSTITVNPQWTIMAMSSLAAKSVLRNTL